MADTSRGAESDDDEMADKTSDPFTSLWDLLTVPAPRPRKRAPEDAEVDGTVLTVLSTEKFDQDQKKFNIDKKNLDTDRKNFDNEMRVQKMGFTVTVSELSALSATRPWNIQEARDMVQKYAHVQYGSKDGEDGGLLYKFEEGMKNSHGWLVYARALNDLAPAEGDPYGVPKDSIIGVLLITSPKRGTQMRDGHSTKVATVNVIATHHLKRQQGVGKEMWNAFENMVKIDPIVGKGRFQIDVEAKSCLNSDATNIFYIQCGFTVPGKGANRQQLNGHITYNDGVALKPLTPADTAIKEWRPLKTEGGVVV